MKFYKFISEASLNAYKKLVLDRSELRANAKIFANQFDAVPIMLQDSDHIWFCGIKFNDNSKANPEIWTKPSREYGHQRLRVRPLKKHLQEEFEAEKKKWDQLHSKYFSNGTRVDKNTFYSTLGFDRSSFFFGSLSVFEYQGAFYISTTIDMENGTEIMGSEYLVAKEAHELEKNQ